MFCLFCVKLDIFEFCICWLLFWLKHLYIYICIYTMVFCFFLFVYVPLLCVFFVFFLVSTCARKRNIELILQDRPRLFWYRHYQKLHEIVKYRSSRAENLTNLREISMRVFFNSKKCEKMTIWSKQIQKCSFSWKQIFEKPHASHQICKKWKNEYTLIRFN